MCPHQRTARIGALRRKWGYRMKTAKLITAGCLLAFLLLCSAALAWTGELDGAIDPALLSFQRSLAGASAPGPALPSSASGPRERGVPASDAIRGNGTRAGYVLSHGGIVPNSESVTVDGGLLARNRDYYVDPVSGMLAFAQPVRVSQLIRTTYRYVPEKDGPRSGLGAPNLALNLGPSTSLGITYTHNTASANQAFDLQTYGLNLATKLGQKSTMANMMYMSSARESGRVPLNLQKNPPTRAPDAKPKSGTLFLHNSDLQTGRLAVKLNYQEVGRDFSGFAVLKQQKAAPDALLGQLEKEKGLRRFGLQADYGLGKDASAGIGWNRIGGDGGDIVRQSFTINGRDLKLSADLQEIDEGFAGLPVLTAAEQQTFAKETGMRRMNLTGDFTLNPNLLLKTYFSRVTAKDAGLVKYGLSLKGKKFDLAANLQDIDPRFDRLMDLADPDKKKMAAEQGMKRYDLTAHVQPSKSVRINSFLYDAKHSTDDVFKRQLTNSIVISPSHGPKLSILRDEVAAGKSGAVSKSLREKFALDHRIGLVSLAAVQDTVTKEDSTGDERRIETRTFHFDTDPKRRASLIGDWRTVEQNDGKFEDTQTLKLNSRLTSDIAFAGMRSVVKTDGAEVVSQEYGLQPGAARDYGMFKQVKWSLYFAQAQNSSGTETRTKAAKLESEIAAHKVAVEYLGAVTKDGQTPVTRSFSIAGSQDPKERLHYDLAYKVRDPGCGPSLLIRRYNADWQIYPSTKLIYNYFSYDEKPGGKLEPIGTERLRLATALTKRLGFIGQWEIADNYERGTSKDTLSLGLSGKVSSLGALEASYGYDRVAAPDGKSSSRTYKLKYDYQTSADHFFTFSGRYTDWSGPRPASSDGDDLYLQLDFKTLFN